MSIPLRAAALLLLPALAAGLGDAPRAAARAVPAPGELVALLHGGDELAAQAGILAQRRGVSDAVRRFGRVLERDRRLADSRVLRVARRQGLRVGLSPGEAEGRAMLQRLDGVPPAQFDREFLEAVRRSSERELARLRRAQRLTPDVRLADLIGRIVPLLEQDRDLAVRLRRRYGA